MVDRVITRLGLSGHESVRIGDEIRSLQDWLGGHRELTRLHRGFVQAQALRAKSSVLDALLVADASAFNGWLSARQVDDVLNEFPGEWSAGESVAALRPLAPRLYSIAVEPVQWSATKRIRRRRADEVVPSVRSAASSASLSTRRRVRRCRCISRRMNASACRRTHRAT